MSESEVKIGAFTIGVTHPPFLVAEMSGNHNQSLERALAIVEAAALSGAHAVKLQTYTADSMTLDIDTGEFVISDPNSLWYGESLYRLYEKAATPWEWHRPIFDRCRKLGMVSFSTAFDDRSVDFLEELNTPAYKIASFENIDLPLIARVAQTGKPVIISTGMATEDEISEAVATARDNGCGELILLKCTSSYPASPSEANLRTIPYLRDKFGLQVGLSDHTLGAGTAVAAVALGATMVEKHFTLSRSEGGVDSAFSLEPGEFRNLVVECGIAWQSLGAVSFALSESVEKSAGHRRSLYVVEDMKAGEVLSDKNMRAIRPGSGLPPKFYKEVIGRKVNKDVKGGTPISWELLQ
jgi:N-acetylneuraminate synthase